MVLAVRETESAKGIGGLPPLLHGLGQTAAERLFVYLIFKTGSFIVWTPFGLYTVFYLATIIVL